jgi:hypothetical protein
LCLRTTASTAEAAFFKGTSSRILLFDLVLRLRKLEVAHRCMLHLVHVAGTSRMIGQRSDGLLRGNFIEGVMMGQTMTSYIPLSRTQRHRVGWFRASGCHEPLKSCKNGRTVGIGAGLLAIEGGKRGKQRRRDCIRYPCVET